MAKRFRKFLIKFLTSVLCTAISFIIISLTFKEVVIDGILSEAIRPVLSSISIGENGEDNYSIFGNNEFVDQILNNEKSKELINGYLETMMNELGSEDQDMSQLEEYDFQGKMEQYMMDNKEELSQETGQEITDEMINQAFSQNGNDDFNNNMKVLINNTRNNLTDEQKSALNSVNYLTSDKIQLYITIGLIVDVLLIVILTWSVYKWLWNIALGMVIGAAFPIGISFLIDYLANSKFGFKVDVSPIHHLALPILIIGFIIGIIYVIIDVVVKKVQKGKDDNEVPRVFNTSA